MLKRFVMSVFDSWLGVHDKLRACLFLIAAAIVLVPALVLEWSTPWRLLQYVKLESSAPGWFTVAPRLAGVVARGGDIVVLLGGSTARESTASDKYLSRELSRHCGREMQFLNAGTTNQRIAASWSIASKLPSGRLKLVLVALNPNRLTESYRDIGVGAPRLREPFRVPDDLRDHLTSRDGSLKISRPAPLRQLGWMFRNWRYVDVRATMSGFVPALGQADLANNDPFLAAQHVYRPPGKPQAFRRAQSLQMIAWRSSAFARKSNEALDTWITFARTFRKKGINVVFVLLPRDPAVPVTDNVLSRGLSKAVAKIERADFKVLNWREVSGLRTHDFFDQFHLLGSGRRVLHSKFVGAIRDSTTNCGGAS